MSPSHLHPQSIVDESDRPSAVILPLDELTALLEDLDDLAAVAERRDEPSVSHTDLLDGLGRDGLLSHSLETIGREGASSTALPCDSWRARGGRP